MPSLLNLTKKHHNHLNSPFPSPATSFPQIKGTLSTSLSSPQTFPIGPHFSLTFSNSSRGPHLSISHSSNPDRPVWRTVPGQPFLSAAAARTTAVESRGSFILKDHRVSTLCNNQSINDIITFDTITIVISGWLSCEARKAGYRFVLEQKTDHQVGFRVELSELRGPARPRSSSPKWSLLRRTKLGFRGFRLLPSEEKAEMGLNRIYLTYESETDERFYGFGEQFSRTEFKGRRVPILVQEQGIGRGDQPITFAANFVSYRYILQGFIS